MNPLVEFVLCHGVYTHAVQSVISLNRFLKLVGISLIHNKAYNVIVFNPRKRTERDNIMYVYRQRELPNRDENSIILLPFP